MHIVALTGALDLLDLRMFFDLSTFVSAGFLFLALPLLLADATLFLVLASLPVAPCFLSFLADDLAFFCLPAACLAEF